MKKIFYVFAVSLIVIFSLLLYLITKSGPSEKNTTITVAKGTTVRALAKDMKDAGIIDAELLFELAARIKKVDRKLRAGEYSFPAKISISDILEKLEKGEVFYRKITLPEGLTTKQFLYMINMEENLIGEISIDVNEGEMLAETYTFSRGDTKDSIVIQAMLELNKALSEAWKSRKETLLKDKYEALILASIIEKETSIPEERNIIASVFINRLDKGMKLQTDPTIIYALTEGKGFLGRSLKKGDMKIDSPYNTYKYKGLPPTPICNVSKESIKAAVNHADTEYLYFVADGKGGHHFSTNYDDHKMKIKEWLSVIRASN